LLVAACFSYFCECEGFNYSDVVSKILYPKALCMLYILHVHHDVVVFFTYSARNRLVNSKRDEELVFYLLSECKDT
jgi:hypothetical protein